jgi:hypothetical protein
VLCGRFRRPNRSRGSDSASNYCAVSLFAGQHGSGPPHNRRIAEIADTTHYSVMTIMIEGPSQESIAIIGK